MSDGREQRLIRPFAGYADEDRPLGSYALLTVLFNAAAAGFFVATSGRNLPERAGVGDVVLLGTATHKLARLIAKDWVTSFLRAPFVRYEGSAGPAEVDEKPRGKGLQLALGELLTCPYCIGQWVAAGLAGGLAVRPRETRLIATTFTALTVADFLHLAYKAAQDRT